MGWRRGDPVLASSNDPFCSASRFEKIKSTSTMVLKFPRGSAFNPLQQRFASPSSISAGTGWWWGCWPRLRHWCFAVALFGLVVMSHWEIPENGGSGIAGARSSTTIAATTPFVSIPPKFTKALAKVLTPLSSKEGGKEEESSSTTSRLKVPPRPVSCHDVRSRVQRDEWTDPNDGVLYARTLRTDPPFRLAVHAQRYDNVRWKSIYKKGVYYETHVHDRFMKILAPPSPTTKTTMPPQLVLDVGMNIGYYTMLSAILGHSVIGFEINPANLIRVCESLDVNQMGEGMLLSSTSVAAVSSVAIFQRGVGNVSDQTLRLVVPRNPGQAKMVNNKGSEEEESATTTDGVVADNNTENAAAPDVVTTITLDAFAEAYNWWEVRPVIALLKIDVEGFEPEIIIGAEQLLKTGMVQNVLTEFRDFHTATAQQAFNILIDNGYVLMYNHGAPYTKAATIDLWDDFTRGRYHEPWRRTARATLLRRPFVKDLWFSLVE